MPIDSTKEFKPINISVLTVSDTRTEATDKSGQILLVNLKDNTDFSQFRCQQDPRPQPKFNGYRYRRYYCR